LVKWKSKKRVILLNWISEGIQWKKKIL
jgi:hypothetical protein